MRQGKITIKANGKTKLKSEGKNLSIPKEFDFGELLPAEGKQTYECQFEGNPISNIVIGGREIAKNQAIIKKKAEEKEAAAQRIADAERQKKETKARERAQKDNTWWDDSFKVNESFLPADTQALLQDSDNFYLKLNKVPRYIEDKKEFRFFKNDYGSKKQTGHKFKIKSNFGNFDFAQNSKKHLELATWLCAKVASQKLSIDWRLVLGLGHHSVYETSMTLHHIYGIPYLPASSIKGIARSWTIQARFFTQLSEEKQNDLEAGKEAEKLALQDKGFCDVFGCGDESVYKEARQGKVIFFDAFPMSEPRIEVDIMNPHYPDYYKEGSKIAPTDDQSPIPIYFLTVSRQAVDKQPLGFRIMTGIQDTQHVSLLETTQNWLQQALTQRGIGAKTAVGYGLMKQ